MDALAANSWFDQHAIEISGVWLWAFATVFGFALAGTLCALVEYISQQRLTLLPHTPLESWLGVGGIFVRILSGPAILLARLVPLLRFTRAPMTATTLVVSFAVFWAFCSGVVALHGLSLLMAS